MLSRRFREWPLEAGGVVCSERNPPVAGKNDSDLRFFPHPVRYAVTSS